METWEWASWFETSWVSENVYRLKKDVYLQGCCDHYWNNSTMALKIRSLSPIRNSDPELDWSKTTGAWKPTPELVVRITDIGKVTMLIKFKFKDVAWFQASAAMKMRSALFRDFAQLINVMRYRRFGTTCWPIEFIHSLVFSLRGRAGRNQSPVVWPVWLWHTASWTSSWG